MASCGVGVSRYPVITGRGSRGRRNARFKRGEIGSIAFSKFLFAVVAPSRVSSRSNYTFLDSDRTMVRTHVHARQGWRGMRLRALDYILYIDLFAEDRVLCVIVSIVVITSQVVISRCALRERTPARLLSCFAAGLVLVTVLLNTGCTEGFVKFACVVNLLSRQFRWRNN